MLGHVARTQQPVVTTAIRQVFAAKVARLLEDEEDDLLGFYEFPRAEIFDAFDVTATYDKVNARLERAATVTPELVEDQEQATAPRGRSRDFGIAGAGFEHHPATGYRFVVVRELHEP